MEYNDFEDQVGGASIRRAIPLVTRPFTSYDRQLLDAIKPGNVNEVDRLLNLGANANTVSEKTFRTPLIKALDKNDLPIVRRLLQGGANPNLKTRYSLSPFKLAFGVDTNRPCSFEIINEMITTGRANVNEDDGNPHSLVLAINKNCLTTISLLLRSGVDPNIVLRQFITGMYTPYFMRNISREAATILLDNGLNITLYGCFGKDGPMWKMFRNILIDRLTNVNLILTFLWNGAETYQLLLDFAVLTDDIELVNILLRKGADPNITTNYHNNEGILDRIDWINRESNVFRFSNETRELKNRIYQILIDAGAINHPINERRHTITTDYVGRYFRDRDGFLTLTSEFPHPELDVPHPQHYFYTPQPVIPVPSVPSVPSVPDFKIPESPTLENFNSLKAKVECPNCHSNLKKVFLNCGHAFCETCTNSLQKNCSICTTPILKKQTIHKKYLFNNL
jgi:hypothetical protein